MNRLKKNRSRLDSVEAYACMCAYVACSCKCDGCYCVCQPYNPMETDAEKAFNRVDASFKNSANVNQGSTQNMQL